MLISEVKRPGSMNHVYTNRPNLAIRSAYIGPNRLCMTVSNICRCLPATCHWHIPSFSYSIKWTTIVAGMETKEAEFAQTQRRSGVEFQLRCCCGRETTPVRGEDTTKRNGRAAPRLSTPSIPNVPSLTFYHSSASTLRGSYLYHADYGLSVTRGSS